MREAYFIDRAAALGKQQNLADIHVYAPPSISIEGCGRFRPKAAAPTLVIVASWLPIARPALKEPCRRKGP